jgi:acetolactate synthase-1/2/3 large subunit
LRLAELLALPVVEWRNRANFPTAHPLYQGDDVAPWLAHADVVLALDHDYPYIPTLMRPAPDATIIQLDLDPIKEQIPLWSFPVDLPIRADTARALDALADTVEALLTDADRARIVARQAALTERSARRRADSHDAALADEYVTPITPSWLGCCLEQSRVEAPDIVVVDEMVTNNAHVWRQLDVSDPESWYGSGGSGLGWALGAALGVKLARPERPVLTLVGDGSFGFCAPLAALWAAQTQAAPIMVVILNNSCYNATKRPLVANYPAGYSVREDSFIGVDLTPAPRYDKLAEVVGAYGERVESPAEVLPALRRALERTRSGQSVVLDVQLAHP